MPDADAITPPGLHHFDAQARIQTNKGKSCALLRAWPVNFKLSADRGVGILSETPRLNAVPPVGAL